MPYSCQEYVPYSQPSNNALCWQILAEGVNQTVAKYHSGPTDTYWDILEKRCDTASEIHSNGSQDQEDEASHKEYEVDFFHL